MCPQACSVILNEEDLVQVGRGWSVCIHGSVEKVGYQDEDIEGWIDPEATPDKESAWGETTGVQYFVKDQSIHQGSTEDEEEVHTELAENSEGAARLMMPKRASWVATPHN